MPPVVTNTSGVKLPFSTLLFYPHILSSLLAHGVCIGLECWSDDSCAFGWNTHVCVCVCWYVCICVNVYWQLLKSYFVCFKLIQGMRERSPPLPKIAHPSLPRLGRSQASTQQSAMPESPPGGTAWLITVSSVPGKLTSQFTALLL